MIKSLIDTYTPGATYVPIRAKLLIDGYCLYLRCRRLAQIRRRQALDICKSAAIAAPVLNVDTDVLVDIAASVFAHAEVTLERHCVKTWETKGHSPAQVFELSLAKFSGGDFEQRIRNRSVDVVIHAYYEAEIFVGATPNLFQIAGLLRKKLATCLATQKSSITRSLNLLSERKIRTPSGSICDLTEFERFIERLGQLRQVGAVGVGITRHDVDNYGSITLQEKGVDALLVIAAMDALEDKDLNIISIMTNDSDYYPVFERIKERGKEAFLLSPEPDEASVSGKLKEAVGGESHVINVVRGELAKAFYEWEGLHKTWPETQTTEFLSGAERYEHNMYEQAIAEWHLEMQRQWDIELANMIEDPDPQA